MWVLLSIALPHVHICASISSSSRLLVNLFLLSGRSRLPTRQRSFRVFAKSIGPCKYVFVPIPSLNAPCISQVFFSDSTLFLSAIAFPFFLPFTSTSALYLPGGHHLFLVPPYILPYFLNLAIPPYSSSPFGYSLPYSSINYGWQPLFWHVPCFILSFQLFHIPVRLEWVHSQFCSYYCITSCTWAS